MLTIFKAGHAIPSYQPETAYRVFTRALFNLDIATGRVSTAGDYTSTGRSDPDVQLTPTGQELTYCYTWAPSDCYDWQRAAIANGTAEICNYLFVDANSTKLFPEVIGKCRSEGNGTGHANGTSGGKPPVEFEGVAARVESGWVIASSLFVALVLALVM